MEVLGSFVLESFEVFWIFRSLLEVFFGSFGTFLEVSCISWIVFEVFGSFDKFLEGFGSFLKFWAVCCISGR